MQKKEGIESRTVGVVGGCVWGWWRGWVGVGGVGWIRPFFLFLHFLPFPGVTVGGWGAVVGLVAVVGGGWGWGGGGAPPPPTPHANRGRPKLFM